MISAETKLTFTTIMIKHFQEKVGKNLMRITISDAVILWVEFEIN